MSVSQQRSSADIVDPTDKHGVFKAKDGWRYRHYGHDHNEGRSTGPYPTQLVAMKALLASFGFTVEDELS